MATTETVFEVEGVRVHNPRGRKIQPSSFPAGRSTRLKHLAAFHACRPSVAGRWMQ
jgi:hypothetical protein